MSDDIVIKVENVSKKFSRSLKHVMLYGVQDIARNMIGLSANSGRLRNGEFWAVKDVSFAVKRGETLGIIGANGSGKTTLLKLLNGIFMPDMGRIEIKGRIGALIEVGAGFHPLLTGRENIYVNGAILGMTRKEIDRKFDEIIDFADIGDFIDTPVKHYSSGMYVRLGFAVAVHSEPDILLIDEVLAVGDIFFQAKCIIKLKEMIENGVTLIFVSHSTGTVTSICKKSLLLDKGIAIDYGNSDKVIQKYFSIKVEREQRVIKNAIISEDAFKKEKLYLQNEEKKSLAFIKNVDFQRRAVFQRIMNGKASFMNIQLLDESENEIQTVEYGQNIILRMAVEISEDIDFLTFGYHIRDKNGVDIVYSDTFFEGKPLYSVKKGERYIIDWRFKATLLQGSYNIACVASIPIDIEIGKVDFCDFVPVAVQFEMKPRFGAKLYGLVHWENKIEVNRY